MKHIHKFDEHLFESNDIIWKSIPDDRYSKYEASNTGLIKNIKTGKVISSYKSKHSKDTVTVSIHNSGKKYNVAVHKLVALAHLDNKNNYINVVHVDGDRDNNNIDNLKWVKNASKYSNHFKYKPSGKDAFDSFKVHQYDMNGTLIHTFDAISDAARALNIPTTNISKVAKGKRNHAGGFVWVYDDEVNPDVLKGVDPEIIKSMKDYYAMNPKLTFMDVWSKYKQRSDPYTTSRIIRGIVYKGDDYISDRAKEIRITIGGDAKHIKRVMLDKHRYYV